MKRAKNILKLIIVILTIYFHIGCTIHSLESLDEPQHVNSLMTENISLNSTAEMQYDNDYDHDYDHDYDYDYDYDNDYDTEVYDKKLTPLEGPTYIEQAFIEFLEHTLTINNEYEVLEDIAFGRLLTQEEFAIFDLGGIEDNLIGRLEDGLGYSMYNKIMLVDADNDGIDDVVIYLHSGGSAGFVDLIFFKGDENGAFARTYTSHFGIYTKNAFVKYNEKNYFLLTSVDYYRKIRTGFEVYCFVNGILMENASIRKAPESFTLAEKMAISDEYNKKSHELSESAQAIYFDIDDYSADNITGSGETKLSDDESIKADEMRMNAYGNSVFAISSWYKADIANDGAYMTYNKGVFWPSNNNTYRHLTLDLFSDSQTVDLLKEFGLDIWVDNRIPQHLWIENINNTNIVFVLSTRGFDEFVIDGYHIQENTYQTVVRLAFLPNYRIDANVYTQNINIDFMDEYNRH